MSTADLLAAAPPPAAAATAAMLVFSGSANPALAAAVAAHLGVSLGAATVGRFADGEANLQVLDNVRGRDVYIVQPTSPRGAGGGNVDNHVMELLLLVSTMRRASAGRVTAVIPYFGYARQDRKMTARVPISAADVARLLETMGVHRVIAVDLHCGQIQGFFGPEVPVDNLYAAPVGVRHFAARGDLRAPVVVSPDAGGVFRAKQFREGLALALLARRAALAAAAADGDADVGFALCIKQRAKAGLIERLDVVGDVAGADAIVVDDLIDTAGTLCLAAAKLKAAGARRVFAFASHGVFSGDALARIAKSELEEVVVTDSVAAPDGAALRAASGGKVTVLSIAPLLAAAMTCVHLHTSVSGLFARGGLAAGAAAAEGGAAAAPRLRGAAAPTQSDGGAEAV